MVALFGSANARAAPPTVLVPAPALSAEAKATPAAQLLSAALTQSRSFGGRSSALIQVPPSPISSETLKALQQSSQQFSVREETVAEQAAQAPARELKRALASVTRETSSTVTTPDTTTTTTIETPERTITRTVTETVTVPGPESAGVQELRTILDNAAARAGEIEDRGNGRSSDRRVARLADSVERRGDRLLDELERAIDRGGSRLERRVERALDNRGRELTRSIDRLFDRGGERGVSAFETLLEQNGARVVQTLGKVLEATGDNVSKKLEDLLVRAGPEVISALKETVDRVRPTVTQEVTREVTEVIPGSSQTVTTTIPGTTSTVTSSTTSTVETPPTPTEVRAEVRRQVAAYSNSSRLLAPIEELSTPPQPVPNPAANLDVIRGSEDGQKRGPIVRNDKASETDRQSQSTRSNDRTSRSEEIRLRPPLVVERAAEGATSIAFVAPPAPSAFSQPGTLVNLAG